MNYVNANVAYNYQKNPQSVSSDVAQSIAGLVIALRDDPTKNRNINFLYPINNSTPNNGAGSPTLLAVRSPKSVGTNPYAGNQTSF